MFHFYTPWKSQKTSRVNIARSVTQISGQLFCYLILIMKIYQIWRLLALGDPPKCLGNFFYGQFRKWGFRWLILFKGEKSIWSNMVILYIIKMQILYWIENTKEPVSENQYSSQYVVGLPTKTNLFIKRGKDMTSPIGTIPAQQFWFFTKKTFNK